MVRSGLKQTGWTRAACASALRLMNVPFCQDGPIYYRLTWQIIAQGYRASLCTLPPHHNKAIGNSNGQYVQMWHLFYGHASIFFLQMILHYLKGRVLFKHNIQEGILPFLNDWMCIWSTLVRLHNLGKRGHEEPQLNTKRHTLYLNEIFTCHTYTFQKCLISMSRNKPAVHDSPVFHPLILMHTS